MFRKALDLQGEKKYSGKDIKKLNALLVAKFGDTAAFGARANVYVKGETSCSQLVTVKGDEGEEYCFGALDAKAFDRAVTAASNGERGKVSDVDACIIFPSLHRLWKALDDGAEGPPCGTPIVEVHPDVTHFVLNGADLMAPGLQGRQYPYPDGSVVAVSAIGNPKPFAVGQWQGNRSSGVAVKVFTRFGDSLWTQNPVKPPGFTPSQILSLQTVGVGGGYPQSTDASSESAARAAGEGEGEKADDAEEGKTQEDERNVGGSAEVAHVKAEMDALLMQAFLQAANTTLKKMPAALPVDVFYSQHVRPARPAGTSIDVHKSSYKKVGKFVEFLKAEDLLSTDKGGQVTSVNRSHPDIRSFTLHEADSTDAGSASNAAKGAAAALYVEGVANSKVEFPLYWVKPDLNKLFVNAAGECISPHVRLSAGKDDAGSNGGDVDLARIEIFVEKAHVAPAIKDFASRHDLMVSKKLVDVKRLGIPALCQESGDADGEPKPVTVDIVARRILEAGTAKHMHHKITTVSLVGEEKISYRQGAPQRVDIRTEKRKNHNVTILQGLDARCYGYDLEKLADFFKKKFSVATFLEEMGSAKMIVIGGFFDRDLEQIISKDLGVPADCVENLAANRKADMKQRKK